MTFLSGLARAWATAMRNDRNTFSKAERFKFHRIYGVKCCPA
ncbi:MAG: hypothetical protein OET81_08985 [Desulfobacteraceae bacterium]|nr:hypothetical protein [Desulfobacteraceae bacterium]MDH3722382.1 hypothetical protein [Desulfobacteraceae bacterium]MDH3837891.1 hypothetical protein [Desulfobacteraceae bacterium]MDH3875986.1 hypothetical protein [Desulfobacteraceae bacterium]MDH3956813.1 hypothetical protein [Desulfobacteraceae bacterium]